jgi:hypothetical protein
MGPAPIGRPTGLPPATPATPDIPLSMDEHHAEFVASHVQAEPDALPEGAADEVEAVVDHLHAVVEVLDVLETVEAEDRVATEDEVRRLEEPQAVLAASEFRPLTEEG